MYQSNTIRQCLWLIATIRQNGRLTLKALQEKWTPDFIGELLKYDQGLEVVDPPELRLKICKIMKEMLNKY